MKNIKIGNETVPLTDREELFVRIYISEGARNATTSAILAGYSKKTAGQIGHEILKKPEIQKLIRHLTAPLLDQLGASQEKVLKELVAVAFSNITDFMQDDYQMKPLSQIDPSKTAAISDARIQESTHIDGNGHKVTVKRVSLKFHDKLKSLMNLAEMTGLMTKKTDQVFEQNNFFKNLNNHFRN